MLKETPEFGTARPGVEYRLRPGGYAIILNEAGELAVVVTPQGVMLPGGGQDAGESLAAAAIREALEECGLPIRIRAEVGVADELVFAPNYGEHFRKRCTFFLAEVVGPRVPHVEADHELLWLPLAEAAGRLLHDSQRWALSQANRQA